MIYTKKMFSLIRNWVSILTIKLRYDRYTYDFETYCKDKSKVFLTSNEDFGDRHLSYWSSSHFFKDETTNHPERKEKSFIQYWFLHTAPLYITPKYFIFHSHTTTNACNILSLHRLSLCLVNIKSQVREYQKNKKKHPFRHGVCRSINPRVQSAANSTIEKSFLFSSRLFRYAYNRMTRGCIL